MSLVTELVNQGADRRFVGPLRITLECTLGGDLDAIHFGQSAEVLEQGAVGQADSQAAKIFQEQSTHDVTAQSSASMDLDLSLCFGGNVLESAPSLPGLEAGGDELGFQATLKEKLIDTQELLAHTLVIDIAFDSGQRGLEQLLNRKQGSSHELSYRLASLTSQEKKSTLSRTM